MQEQDPLTNQTAFSGVQPLYQSPETSATQPPELDQLAQKPWFKTKKLFLAVIPAVFLILLLVVALLPRNEAVENTLEATPPPAIESTNDPLLQRIQRLQAELKEADPTKTDILFPPVDMELQLDKAQK